MRVDRTIAFVDLSLFTAYTLEWGDAAAAEVLAGFRGLVREVASRRSIRVAKWLGDGAMLVSQDATAAVATALELHHRAGDACGQLPLRTGMAGGPVMLFEGDDYLGTAVNLAARLCDVARPHEILASVEIADAVPRWAASARAGARKLKGFTRPMPVVTLQCQPRERDGFVDPVCGLPLVRRAPGVIRTLPDGTTVAFCASSCEDMWQATLQPSLPNAI